MAEGTPGARIGRNVRAAREAALYTRPELAGLSGIAVPTIEALEYGTVERPRRATIEKLAKALGVDVATLLDTSGPETDAPKAEAPRSSERDRQRRAKLQGIREDYREARAGLDRYCDLWERRLLDDDLDRQSVREFLDAAGALQPTLDVSVVDEMLHLAHVFDVEGGSGITDEMRREAVMIHVAHRFYAIGRRVEAVWTERFARDPGDLANVVDFTAAIEGLPRAS